MDRTLASCENKIQSAWQSQIKDLLEERKKTSNCSQVYAQILSAVMEADDLKDDSRSRKNLIAGLQEITKGGDRDLTLSILQILRLQQGARGVSDLIRLSRNIGNSYFHKGNLDSAIASYECAKSLTIGNPNTPAVILASIYFKRALNTFKHDCESLYPSIANDLGKAHANRFFLFELCRIYFSRTELEPYKGTLVKLSDILSVATKVFSIIQVLGQADIDSFNVNLLRLGRDAARLVKDTTIFSQLRDDWLDRRYALCKDLISRGLYDESVKLSLKTAEILPYLYQEAEKLSPLYHHLSFAYNKLGLRNEAKMYAQLSLSISLIPPINSDNGYLVNLCKENAIGSDIVVAYLSEAYIDIFKIWFQLFKRFKRQNLVMIALDCNAALFLDSLNIPHILRPYYFYQSDFINASCFTDDRVRVVADIVSGGLNVMLTGVDSLWIKDPIEYIHSRQEDIISMGGATRIKNWPVCFNADLFFLRSSTETVTRMPRLLDYSDRFNWDQDAFCFLTSELDFSFQKLDSGAWTGNGHNIDFSAHVLSASFATRDINLVSQDTYIYQPPQGSLESKVINSQKVLDNLQIALPVYPHLNKRC